MDASHPLFILYTSGSTGKPKGIVHAHGGYLTGLCATCSLVFDLSPKRNDVFFVVATPGWITGQSYMIAAALLMRVPSVLLEGSPVSPPDRFAAIIARHKVTVLKAGSTFLRMLMTRAERRVAARAAQPRDAAASGHLLRRAGQRRGAQVCNGAPHAQLHQLVLGDRARRHRVEPLLQQRRPAAARRHAQRGRCHGWTAMCSSR